MLLRWGRGTLVVTLVIVVDLDNDGGDVDGKPPTADVDDKHKDTVAPPKGKPKMPAATAVTLKKKAAAGSKTTGETELDHLPAAPIRVVLKTYGLSTYGKYAVSEYAEGSLDCYNIEFYVNGVLPEVGGYFVMLMEDGYTLKWSRPIEEFLFTMGHLKSIMGENYFPSHI